MTCALVRRGWKSASRAWLLAFGVVCLVYVVRRRARDEDSQCGSRQDDPLSITSRADGAFPPDMSPVEASACLQRRTAALGRPTRLTFVGHSRARQVFEQLSTRLGLSLLTRAEIGDRVPFVDQLLEPPWHHFADANSTCVGVWPKGRAAGQPAHAWCSMVAVGPQIELEFRWRHSLHLFRDVFHRLEEGCARRALCPDVLLVNQGLHFLVVGRFSRFMPILRELVQEAAPYVRRLAAYGVRVLWVLEQPGNPRSSRQSYNDDSLALNALLTEQFGGRRGPTGVQVWTSAASVVAEFWTRTCYALMPRVTPDQFQACAYENYHVDNGTLAILANQLLRSVCGD